MTVLKRNNRTKTVQSAANLHTSTDQHTTNLNSTHDDLNSELGNDNESDDIPLIERLNQLMNSTNSDQLIEYTAKLYNNNNNNNKHKKLYTNGFTNQQIWLQLQRHNQNQLQQLGKNITLLNELNGIASDNESIDQSQYELVEQANESDNKHNDNELEDDQDQDSDSNELFDELVPNDNDSHSNDINNHSNQQIESNDSSDDDAIDFEMLKKGQFKHDKSSDPNDDEFTDDIVDYAALENNSDDGFYDVNDMEQFADQDGNNVEEAGNDSEIDLDADVEEFDMNKLAEDKYSTFFDDDKKQSNSDDINENDDSDDEFTEFVQLRDDIRDDAINHQLDNNTQNIELSTGDHTIDQSNYSTYEKQQHKIHQQIIELEHELVGGKEWDTIGEVDINNRPTDSLLTKQLEYDYIGRIDQPVTQQHNEYIESLIKQRIIDNQYDDVVKVIDINQHNDKANKKSTDVVLNDNKSTLSLAQIYEREYTEQYNTDNNIKSKQQIELEHKYKEIDLLFAKLNYKLDSLTNFHYTPRPNQSSDMVVQSNKSAITLEEVIPTSMNNNQLITSNELYTNKKHNAQPIAHHELSQAERKRKRIHKKQIYSNKQKSISDEQNEKQRRLDVLNGNSNTHNKTNKQINEALSASNVQHVTGNNTKSNYNQSTKIFNKLQKNNNNKNKDSSIVPIDNNGITSSSVML